MTFIHITVAQLKYEMSDSVSEASFTKCLMNYDMIHEYVNLQSTVENHQKKKMCTLCTSVTLVIKPSEFSGTDTI
jgi:hypothetical protein